MKVSREEIAERIADRLHAYADMKELSRFYWDAQYEWATDISDEELMETVTRLDILEEGEEFSNE